MTLMLQVRALADQASKLEKDLELLNQRTSGNEQFQRDHAARIKTMENEIRRIKEQGAEVEDSGTGVTKDELEKYQRLVEETRDSYRKEVLDLRRSIDEMSSQLDQLSQGKDATIVLDQVFMPPTPVKQMETRSMARKRQFIANQLEGKCKQSKDEDTCAGWLTMVFKAGAARIDETLSSTRRWNRDHKTTSLSDSEFVAKYLKQQGKRDPVIAGHIQRAIRRRIRNRECRKPSGQPRSPPRSLEEFCQNAIWLDVIESVELMVNNKEHTLTQLKQKCTLK